MADAPGPEHGLAGVEPVGPVSLQLPAGVHHLCGCGRSRHGWFCDGAHLGSGRVFHELRLEQPSTVVLCGCGRSPHYPFCDGSHRSNGFEGAGPA